MKRRGFLQAAFMSTVSMAAGSGLLSAFPYVREQRSKGLGHGDKNLAIAMWDFCWILRHHRLGEFEDWDRVLEQLAERGYNAVRIDCLPQLVASDRNGKVQETFFHPGGMRKKMWGGEYSIDINPRLALAEFLPKCKVRGIHVGLATWFLGIEDRNKEVIGKKDFVRVWDETLQFLDREGLLDDNILYVDLLNEYPMWNGFQWLHDSLKDLGNNEAAYQPDPDKVHEQNVIEGLLPERRYNQAQVQFYSRFMSEAIAELKGKWPRLDFFASLSKAFDVPWQDLDLRRFDALDVHVWFVHNREFSLATDYFKEIHPSKEPTFKACYEKMTAYWKDHRDELVNWMEREIQEVAAIGRKYGVPVGNTEGWGPIMFIDHPHLDWNWTKEAGSICVDLALKHGYKFICTSNFTHPQFTGIWQDVKWHRTLCERIKAR